MVWSNYTWSTSRGSVICSVLYTRRVFLEEKGAIPAQAMRGFDASLHIQMVFRT